MKSVDDLLKHAKYCDTCPCSQEFVDIVRRIANDVNELEYKCEMYEANQKFLVVINKFKDGRIAAMEIKK